MEIEVVKDTKLELEMIIHGENHSLCNVLRKYLMEDSDVEYAVYGIDHPLTGEPIMTIKTKRTKRPRDSLLRAAQRLKDETDEFKELIDAIDDGRVRKTSIRRTSESTKKDTSIKRAGKSAENKDTSIKRAGKSAENKDTSIKRAGKSAENNETGIKRAGKSTEN